MTDATDIIDHLIRHRLPPISAEARGPGRVEDDVLVQSLTVPGTGKSAAVWIGLGINQHGVRVEFPVYINRYTAKVPLGCFESARAEALTRLRDYAVKSMHRAMMSIPGERGSQQPGDIERLADYDGWTEYPPIPGLLTGPLTEIGHWVECSEPVVTMGVDVDGPWLIVTEQGGGVIVPGLNAKHRIRWVDTIDPPKASA